MRSTFLLLALCLAGCDSLSLQSDEVRLRAESVTLVSVDTDESDRLRATFRYTGRAPEAGCYGFSGFSSRSGALGGPNRNQVEIMDVIAREITAPCETLSALVTMENLAIGIPSEPPGTYSFLFERRGDQPLIVAVTLDADGAVVEN